MPGFGGTPGIERRGSPGGSPSVRQPVTVFELSGDGRERLQCCHKVVGILFCEHV
jgi:hypothetical protein